MPPEQPRNRPPNPLWPFLPGLLGGQQGSAVAPPCLHPALQLGAVRVAQVGEDGVTLEVDRWYKGGDADVVRLANYDVSTVSLDGFTFEEGNRYLVTATDGTVNFCGYSVPWNQERADAFEVAFSS